MSSNIPGMEWNAKTLRAWQLAILRFAVTLDNADRLAVMAIANEIDRLAPQSAAATLNFSFFRRTSAELCAAILEPNELASMILRRHLAQIDDDRLGRALAATLEIGRQKVSIDRPIKRDSDLWQGLSPNSRQI
jgi:hypothetical protein